jgi:hypothetical protein
MIGNIIPEDVNFGLSPEHGYLLQRYGKYYSSLFNKHGQSVPSPIPVCLPSLMCVLLLYRSGVISSLLSGLNYVFLLDQWDISKCDTGKHVGNPCSGYQWLIHIILSTWETEIR